MVRSENFTPFFGVVEDVDDPQKIGRVRVRVHGYHSQSKGNIPTENLQWMSVTVSNSTSVLGRGNSPTGYEVGTTVFGYFVDKTLQTGLVVGALVGKTQGRNDVSELARGEAHQVLDLKKKNRVTGIRSGLDKGEWSEPETKYNAEYPYNNVYESHRGHIKEFDDTPDAERIHEYHRAGTYYEVGPNGERVVKVVGDQYEIIAGANNVAVFGNVNITINGNCNQYITGDWNVQVDGDKNEVVQGSVNQYHAQGSSIASDGVIAFDGGSTHIQSGKASGNKGMAITTLPEYDLEFATPVIEVAGRYAAFDEPGEINSTPDSYPEDTKPAGYDGEPKEESQVSDQEKETPELGDCMEIETPINYNMKLSENYTIGDLSRNALFAHDIRAQKGLSEQEIVCNLQKLTENIIEPLRAEFGAFRINSGFRKGSGRSDHNSGSAVDIQEPTWSVEKHFEVAKWIAENLAYKQLITEHGNNVWLHISFDTNTPTQKCQNLTMINGQYENGLKLYY